MNTMTDAVMEVSGLLSQSHPAAVYNGYGKCIGTGHTVREGVFDQVRVTHTTQDPDWMGHNQPSDDDLSAERHQMVAAYARILEAAGWDVRESGLTSRRPYLLVRRTTS